MFDNSIRTFRLVNYLLVGLILVSILLLTRTLLSISFIKKPLIYSGTAAVSPAQNTLKNKSIMHYADILRNNPFGPPLQLQPISLSNETVTKPASLSNLVLLGTASGSGKLSYAIITDQSLSPTENKEIFALGSEVYNYGTLNRVETTYVEITRDSSIYTLKLPEIVSPSTNNVQKQAARKSKDTFARQISEREYILDKRSVQESIENPERIMTDARLLPNFVNGKQEGFAISEVVPDGLYHSLGLRNGDILLKVNGLSMSSPEVAIQAMTALRGMNRVNLDVTRSGKKMSMSYQIR